MEIWSLILFVLGVLLFWDVVYAIFGLLFTRFSFVKHPWLHRKGVRMLAMSIFVPDKVVSNRCQMPCDSIKCGNWNCPNYSCPENGKKKAKYGSIESKK